MDGRRIGTEIPLKYARAFEVAEGVECIAPNHLPDRAPGHPAFVVVGAGKTAMDAALWLLRRGADPDAIAWVRPRDAWMINRRTTQPGPDFFHEMMGGAAGQAEVLAAAAALDDIGPGGARRDPLAPITLAANDRGPCLAVPMSCGSVAFVEVAVMPGHDYEVCGIDLSPRFACGIEAWLEQARELHRAGDQHAQLANRATSRHKHPLAHQIPRLTCRVQAHRKRFRHRSLGSTQTICRGALRRIRNVIRMGHVRRIEPGRMILDQGEVPLADGALIIDCAASAAKMARCWAHSRRRWSSAAER